MPQLSLNIRSQEIGVATLAAPSLSLGPFRYFRHTWETVNRCQGNQLGIPAPPHHIRCWRGRV